MPEYDDDDDDDDVDNDTPSSAFPPGFLNIYYMLHLLKNHIEITVQRHTLNPIYQLQQNEKSDILQPGCLWFNLLGGLCLHPIISA